MIGTKHMKSNDFFSNSLLSVMVMLTWFWQWTPRSPFATKKRHQNPPTVGCKNCHRNYQRKCSKQRHLTVLTVYWSDVSDQWRSIIINNLWSIFGQQITCLSTYSAPAHPTHGLNAAALEHATNHPATKKPTGGFISSVIVTASTKNCWWWAWQLP